MLVGMLVLYSVLVAGLLVLPVLLSHLFPYWLRDVSFFLTIMRIQLKVKWKMKRNPNFTCLEILSQRVQETPDKPFLLYGDEVYSYSEVDKLSTQAARALLQHSALRPGGCAAVYMTNCPAYVWIWLGLCKMGCSMACLNYNIRSNSLLNCFTCSGATVLIASADLLDTVDEIKPSLQEKTVQIFSMSSECSTDGVESLLDKVKASSEQPLSDALRSGVTYKSTAMYIFTSGTTGLPKAAILKHHTLLLSSNLLEMVGATSRDIIYMSLPLYHASAMMVGLHGCLLLGATSVLRSKFSVSQFWEDCRKHHVTVILYVGEMLRYLCNGPQKPNDREHNVRIAVGNGLRPEMWKKFLERFGPIQICEFYGATEGNMGFLNYVGKVGAIGRVNMFHKMAAPFELIKYNTEEDHPVRETDGRCIKVPRGEVGLFISKITKNARFHGYAGDKLLSERKILKDVFTVGDCYFNSGDLLMFDEEGFMYFKDRVGDTFRWKGENVSTREVEAVLVQSEFVEEVTVYGVSLPGTLLDNAFVDGLSAKTLLPPFHWDTISTYRSLNPVITSRCDQAGAHSFLWGFRMTKDSCIIVYKPHTNGHEGRIGMASIQLKGGACFNGKRLYDHVRDYLPRYATPYFIRIQGEIEVTGTYKQCKQKLVKEGFDPKVIHDPLYHMDEKEACYVPMTQEFYHSIQQMRVKL